MFRDDQVEGGDVICGRVSKVHGWQSPSPQQAV
jgi:hypothetical protein